MVSARTHPPSPAPPPPGQRRPLLLLRWQETNPIWHKVRNTKTHLKQCSDNILTGLRPGADCVQLPFFSLFLRDSNSWFSFFPRIIHTWAARFNFFVKRLNHLCFSLAFLSCKQTLYQQAYSILHKYLKKNPLFSICKSLVCLNCSPIFILSLPPPARPLPAYSEEEEIFFLDLGWFVQLYVSLHFCVHSLLLFAPPPSSSSNFEG